MPIRAQTFPKTEPPPDFIGELSHIFDRHDKAIGAASNEKRFGSDAVLAILRDDLVQMGFEIEQGKSSGGKIARPVYFGEGGIPTLKYFVDGYHPAHRCGLEVEAGRGMMGNAFYRDLIQALVMTGVDHLVVAMLNKYEYAQSSSPDYQKAADIADALYGHSRIALPFGLTVIGYGPE